jgi:acyl-CoA dehydrogenase
MGLIGFIFWTLVFFTMLIVLCYRAAELRTATIATGVFLLIFTVFGDPGNIFLAVDWLLFAVLVSFNIPEIRRNYVSKQVLKFYKAVLPSISQTEKEAIDAGGIWWDGEIFSGNPNWDVLRNNPKPKLTKEEQAFLDGPVEEVCQMTNNWAVNHKDYDLTKEVWDFLKNKGFFSMIIPKKYGGLEFSPLAVATVMSKITTRSGVLNSTVGVPNSLGPAELLLHYGTPEQRNELLPKLASGEEIPCFALTGPRAGSDATAMPDTGVVCKGKFEGEEIIGMKLNFNKRYITLAPVATLVGLAFKLYDPDHLIGDQSDYGITCALIPSKTEGLETGNRHLPLGIPFMNGTIIGTDVFVPLDYIIGGIEQAGKGWRMLVECLSAGRAISLPSGAMGGAKAAACSTGSYARIREQFNIPIAEFEGIAEPLGRIAGYTYVITAAVNTTAMAIGTGEKPAVISAIMKYHTTEMARKIVLDAMDIHGGKAVMRGPKNYMASGYEAGPIGITVEGANILTRSLIIFGQGAFRCHPYILKEIEAVEQENEDESLEQFDRHFFNHVAYALSNSARSLVLGISNRFGNSPVTDKTENYYKQINRFSAAFALLTDLSMLVLGGSLKRKETLSARLGDVLSSLYLASTTLKYYEDQGDKETDLPMVHWGCKTLIFEAQNKIHEILINFPNRFVAMLLRLFIFPLGRNISGPSIKNTLEIGDLISRKTKTREKLCQGVYLKDEPSNHLAMMERALGLYETAHPIKTDLMKARKKGLIKGNTLEELMDAALKQEIITQTQADQLNEFDRLTLDIINVDDFSEKELKTIR